MNRLAGAVVLVFLGCVADAGHAQQWPQHPVKLVVPYAAGGNTDFVARLIGQRLSTAFGQQFVIENRVGAGGAIAAEYVARSAPDGYTMCVCALSQLAPVALTQKVGYDPLKDFTPIANIGANGFVIAVAAKLPVTTLAEFVAYARARPNQLNYGSGGIGSMTHLAAALFLQRVGVELIHVPYKGGAPALTDTIAGQVEMYAASPSEVLGVAATRQLRLLAISDRHRIAQMSDVPTIAETYPDFLALTWNGLLGPAGIPVQVVDRVADEVRRALADPAFVDRLAAAAVEPAPTDPAEFAAEIRSEHAMWRDVVARAGLQVRE